MKQKGSDDKPYVNEKLANKHEELGDLYFLYKRYEDALENFNRSVQLSKDKTRFVIKSIDCLLQMKLLSRALREAEQYENQARNNVELLLKIAQIHYQLGDHAQASEYWEKVLEKDPRNTEAKSYLSHSRHQETYINP